MDIKISDAIEFQCSNGGVLQIVGDDGSTNIETVGSNDSFAYYDDLYINSYNDMIINVDGEYNVNGSINHLTGNEVMSFKLSSLEVDSKADFKLTKLRPDSWYRLRFNGTLAKCNGGRAHGRTNGRGVLTFNKVEIPNE